MLHTRCCYSCTATSLWVGGCHIFTNTCRERGEKRCIFVCFVISFPLFFVLQLLEFFACFEQFVTFTLGFFFCFTLVVQWAIVRINRHCSCLTILLFHIIFHSFFSDDILQHFDQFAYFSHVCGDW